MSKPWQSFEKRVAGIFNSVRTPFSGSNSGITSSDSLHDRVFIECKYHATDTALVKLMKETEEKAKVEKKLPLLAIGNPEDTKKNIYVMFNIKDLYKVIKEVDLSELDQRFPDGTTIHKLVETSSSENRSLFELKEQLTIEIKRIMREKVIGNDSLEDVKTLSAILYMIDTIMDYSKEECLDEGGS